MLLRITKQQLQNAYKLKFNVITIYHELQQLIYPDLYYDGPQICQYIMYCYYARS